MSSTRRAALLCVVVVFGVFGPLVVAPDAQSAPGRAGVVVVHSDNTVHVECERIPEDGARAFVLLNRTSFDIYSQFDSRFGRALCWLDGEGVAPPNCFDFATGKFWGFYVQKRGQSKPVFQQTGISTTMIYPGSVVYFEYAAGDPANDFAQPAPPPQRLGEICG
jgi:hypothetical protein